MDIATSIEHKYSSSFEYSRAPPPPDRFARLIDDPLPRPPKGLLKASSDWGLRTNVFFFTIW